MSATAEIVELSEAFHFEAGSHTYRDKRGVVVPSVTQLFRSERLIDYSMVPPKVLEHAAWRGTMVHKATCMLDQNVNLLEEYDVDPELVPYLIAYQRFQVEACFQLIAGYNEFAMVGEINGTPLAGTLDRICMIYGEPAVLEIKTTAKTHPCWELQTEAYKRLAQAQDLTLKRMRLRRYALSLKPSGTYKLHPYDDDAADYDTLLALLHMHRWKAKHRLLAA